MKKCISIIKIFITSQEKLGWIQIKNEFLNISKWLQIPGNIMEK